MQRSHTNNTPDTGQAGGEHGLTVRLALSCHAAGTVVRADLELGTPARFYPSNEALARWAAHSADGMARVVYE